MDYNRAKLVALDIVGTTPRLLAEMRDETRNRIMGEMVGLIVWQDAQPLLEKARAELAALIETQTRAYEQFKQLEAKSHTLPTQTVDDIQAYRATIADYQQKLSESTRAGKAAKTIQGIVDSLESLPEPSLEILRRVYESVVKATVSEIKNVKRK